MTEIEKLYTLIFNIMDIDKNSSLWRLGRNEVFHYFPHNLRSLNYEGAVSLIHKILDTINLIAERLLIHTRI